jgi:DNA-binding response OmpR family regulator
LITVGGLTTDIGSFHLQARSVHVGDADSQWLLGQARARNLPLVLMSATGGAGEVMKGIELGAVDYLEKPVSLPKLRNIWQHVVRKVGA